MKPRNGSDTFASLAGHNSVEAARFQRLRGDGTVAFVEGCDVAAKVKGLFEGLSGFCS